MNRIFGIIIEIPIGEMRGNLQSVENALLYRRYNINIF